MGCAVQACVTPPLLTSPGGLNIVNHVKRFRSRLTRRGFVNAGLSALGAVACGRDAPSPSRVRRSALPKEPICFPTKRPNILFISIDDLNDFASVLGGYPGIKTPNIDRLAAQGVAFERAYCSVPSCGGSRSATLSGIAPYRSGLYSQENIIDPNVKKEVLGRVPYTDLWSLPRYFKQQGYRLLGGGKIFHGGYGSPSGVAKPIFGHYDSGVWDEYRVHNFEATKVNYRSPSSSDGRLQAMIGRAYDNPAQEALTPDKSLATWAAGHLEQASANGTPFFLGLGFFRPHISWYVPSRFYDMYPLKAIQVPDFSAAEADITDLPPFAKQYMLETHWATNESGPSSTTDHYDLDQMPYVEGRGGHAQAIQAYLASTSFTDECLGQVLDALEASAVADNTIIVLWSDHGWFLGEKLGWRKFKLWERSARVPFIISAPGGAQNVRTSAVSSLLDIFPTLVDLAFDGQGPAPPQELDGQSLRPVLEDPSLPWPSAAITSYRVDLTPSLDPVVHSLRTDRWRYVSYPEKTGGLFEELYDLKADPQEKDNLLYSAWSAHAGVRRSLRQLLLARAPVDETAT